LIRYAAFLMADSIAAIAFIALFGMAILWLVLCQWVFRRLKLRHLAKYELMGNPHLIRNNTPRMNWELLRFVLGGGWAGLEDPELSGVGQFIRVLFVVYLVGFGFFLSGLFAGVSS
jgi:hypothetical protein